MTLLARLFACLALVGLSACALVPGGGDSDEVAVRAIAPDDRLLLASTHQAVMGNPNGDVTIVEFSDYNCTYCRGVSNQISALIDEDPGLRVVLKDWPLFGYTSTDAARVSIAARMQDGGPRFRAFHEALFKPGLRASKPRALEVAEKVGYDVAKLEADLDSEEVNATLAEVASLAKGLRAPGTPVLVIGKQVIRGQTRYDAMKAAIARAREANGAASPSG